MSADEETSTLEPEFRATIEPPYAPPPQPPPLARQEACCKPLDTTTDSILPTVLIGIGVAYALGMFTGSMLISNYSTLE